MNPMDILKNFQNIQSRMKEMQDKVKEIIVTGTAGGDMVSVQMNGAMEVTGVTISKEVVDPDDIEMLQDLVVAAHRDAMAKAKEQLQEQMSSLTGGMDLPPELMGM